MKADTTATHLADSTALDSAAHVYYAPQYADGFPHTATDSTATDGGPLDSLTVIDVPDAGYAHDVTHSPLHDYGAMGLLLAALFLLVTSYRTGYKYIENLPHYLFSVKRRDSLFDDHTVSETRIMVALLVTTWVLEGIMLFYGVAYTQPTLAGALYRRVFLYVTLFTGMAALFHLVQAALYRLLGWTFGDTVSTNLWLSGFNASQAAVGILLLPVIVVAVVYPSLTKTTLILAVSLYFLGRILFICKGFRIFFNNFGSSLFFILYLCSVEIVPPLLLYAGTIALCNVIQ